MEPRESQIIKGIKKQRFREQIDLFLKDNNLLNFKE